MSVIGSPVAVKDAATRVVEAPESVTARTVRNAGSHTVTLSRSSKVAAAKGFDVTAGKEAVVWFMPGESLWGICASGQESSVEVL